MASPLKQTYSYDVSGLSKGQAQANEIVRRGASEWAKAFASIGNVSENVEKSMRSFAREQRSQARVVAYYASEVVSLTGASKGAVEGFNVLGGAAMEVAGAFSGPLGLLGAIGLVSAGLQAGMWAWKQYTEDAAKTKKAIEGVKKSFEDLYQTQLRGKGTAAEETYIAAMAKPEIREAIDKVNAKLATAQERLARLKRESEEAKRTGSMNGPGLGQIAVAQEDVDRLLRQRDAITRPIEEEFKKARQLEIVNEAAERLKKGQEAEQKIEEERTETRKKAIEKSTAELAAVIQKREAELGRIYLEAAKSSERPYLAGTPVQAAIGSQVADLRGQQAQQADQAAMYQGYTGGSTQFDQVAGALQQSKLDEELKKNEQQWNRWSDTVGGALANALVNGENLGEAMSGIMKQMAAEGLKYALKMIMQAAGMTGANVMAEQSKLGPWGWLTGIGQAAAAFAAAAAFKGLIGSAEGGRENPAFGGPFPMLTHRGEITLHRFDSAALKRLDQAAKRGEPMGGPTYVTINVPNVYDSEGFKRVVRREIDTLTRALNDERGDGRF